jgi:hypothetical protein
MINKIRVKAQFLKVGDIVTSGEIVHIAPQINYKDPKRVYLSLIDSKNKVRNAEWNKNTEISVQRNQND